MSLYNGISAIHCEPWSSPDAVLASHACSTGYGAYGLRLFFHIQFSKFITTMKLDINALELLTVMVTLKVWGFLLRGKRLQVFL